MASVSRIGVAILLGLVAMLALQGIMSDIFTHRTPPLQTVQMQGVTTSLNETANEISASTDKLRQGLEEMKNANSLTSLAGGAGLLFIGGISLVVNTLFGVVNGLTSIIWSVGEVFGIPPAFITVIIAAATFTLFMYILGKYTGGGEI